jgi:hydroxymethylglutaryl-CoA synthase
MMKGIVGHAVRLPAYAITRDEIARAWQSSSAGGQRRCVRFDEDSLTLAATAAQDCLGSIANSSPSGLLFASTTAPHLERSNASLIAAVCDIPQACFVMDFASSLRGATSSLQVALSMINGGDDESIIVSAADTREAEPGSAEEMFFGDAGAAVALGSRNVIAEFISGATIYDDFLDTVRRDRDHFITSFASKFSTDRGYIAPMQNAIQMALKQAGLTPQQVSKAALSSPDKRSHLQLARRLGLAESQVQDILFEDVGLTGTAMPLVLLSAALESAQPGEIILVAAYGNGADALVFRVTDNIRNYRNAIPISNQVARVSYASYTQYRKARDYYRQADNGLEISNVFYAKEEHQNVRLHGSECLNCGTRQFPVTQVCVCCRHGDQLREIPLPRSGTVFTFAQDELYPSPFPPTLMAVVDLKGGGRIYCELVDCSPSDVRIGMPVDLMFRKIKEGGGLYHYYWKCCPGRGL